MKSKSKEALDKVVFYPWHVLTSTLKTSLNRQFRISNIRSADDTAMITQNPVDLQDLRKIKIMVVDKIVQDQNGYQLREWNVS